MSFQQCEECRLALVRAVFDPVAGDVDRWACQLDETFSEQTREVSCPFFVGWTAELPPPARSCKKSQGKIDGCSTSSGSCGDCGSSGGCGSGGCGMGDPAEALEFKWDPEEESVEAAPEAEPHDHAHDDHDHDDHAHDDHAHDDHAADDHPHDDHDHAEPPPAPAEPRPAASCGSLKWLERMRLGRDEDAPIPEPLED